MPGRAAASIRRVVGHGCCRQRCEHATPGAPARLQRRSRLAARRVTVRPATASAAVRPTALRGSPVRATPVRTGAPGYQPYGPGRYGGYEHPQGTTILVLGILSLVVCGILGPIAWSMGSKALPRDRRQPVAVHQSRQRRRRQDLRDDRLDPLDRRRWLPGHPHPRRRGQLLGLELSGDGSSAQPDSDGRPSASPPTARAVAVVELLVSADAPMRVSAITRRLGLSRATCAAILDSLEQLQWVERADDRSYRPGPGLIPVANAVRGRLPVLRAADPLMRELVHRLGVEAATLSRLDSGFLTLVETVHRSPDVDMRPSFRLPMFPPFGAAVVAFATESERDQWLDRVTDPVVREHIARTLESIRLHGVAVWDHDRAGQLLQDAVASSGGIARRLGGPLHCDPVAERQLSALALALGRSGFTDAQLRKAKQPFAISYLAAAVFDAVEQPCFSLELHLLRTDVRIDELRTIMTALRRAADELTTICGGDTTAFDWRPLP